jgi:hypothetical protein
MPLRLSIINDRMEELHKTSGDKPDVAFMKFVYSLFMDCDYNDLPLEDVVDGGDDKQIDVVSIEEDTRSETADILIIQAKNSESFSTNALTLLGNGLSWLFEKPKAQYQSLTNVRFARKIEEVRDVRNRLGPSNMRVRVFFVSKGDTGNLAKDFVTELGEINEKYKAGAFAEFAIEPAGASELVDILAERERRQKQVDDQLPIIYDRNKPSYIQYRAHGLTGYICTVRASEIARLVAGEREKSVFDLNLRRFYGIRRGRVNPEIAATCSDSEASHMFWFFNNGITLVCDRCQVVDDPDNTHLKLTNLQIVNGCQTSMTLAKMAEESRLQDNTEVLLKIFETTNASFVGRVVLTTNNQNAISSRDLKANDPIQVDYQKAFDQLYNLRYERKPREFARLPPTEAQLVVSNEKVAQAYLAIVKKKPTIARTQKYRIWDAEWYAQLFPNATIEKHVLSYLIYDFCLQEKATALEKWSADAIRYAIVSYGVFHLARVLAFRFTQKENWDNTEETNAWISQIRCSPSQLRRHYSRSVTLIKNLMKKLREPIENINNVFKASEIEGAINAELHGDE